MGGSFEPGWKWSTNLKPIADRPARSRTWATGMAGSMKIIMDDGGEFEIGPGEAAAILPCHDAEVVGDETCVWIDFGEISEYAKR